MDGSPSFSAFAIPGIPLIQPGDDLVEIILAALDQAQCKIKDGDVFVISSKIVSKAEGCVVDLNSVVVSTNAVEIAERTHKDPRVVELVLQESQSISRMAPGVLITEHRLGFVSANAGIDESNINGEDRVLLLPHDPSATAKHIRTTIVSSLNRNVAVVISDTHGRPFRMGNVGVALSVAGLPALLDLRGKPDLFGRTLVHSQLGYADMLASAAHLLCGEANEGYPVVVLRGLIYSTELGDVNDLLRPRERDLYR